MMDESPFFIAFPEGHIEICKIVDNGEERNLAKNDGITPLQTALITF